MFYLYTRAGAVILDNIRQPGQTGNMFIGTDTQLTMRRFAGNIIDIGVLDHDQPGTAFGQFLAPGVADGTDVDIVFRPQHVRLDFDRHGSGPLPTSSEGVAARGVVERARFLGHESLIEFRMDHDGSILKVTVPNVFLPQDGRAMWLTVRRDRCFVFPA